MTHCIPSQLSVADQEAGAGHKLPLDSAMKRPFERRVR